MHEYSYERPDSSRFGPSDADDTPDNPYDTHRDTGFEFDGIAATPVDEGVPGDIDEALAGPGDIMLPDESGESNEPDFEPSSVGPEEAAQEFRVRAEGTLGMTIPDNVARVAGEIISRRRISDPRASGGMLRRGAGLTRLIKAAMEEGRQPKSSDTTGAESADAPSPLPLVPKPDPYLDIPTTMPNAERVTEAVQAGIEADVFRPDDAPDRVGDVLSRLWSDSNLPLPVLAQNIGCPADKLVELFNGAPDVSIPGVLIPLLQELGVGTQQGLSIIDHYMAEQDVAVRPQEESASDVPTTPEPIPDAAGSEPPEGQTQWASGQIREGLQALHRAFEGQGGIHPLLRGGNWMQRRVVLLIANTDLPYSQIAKQLNITGVEVAQHAQRALRAAMKNVPEGQMPADMPIPHAKTIIERTDNYVGGQMDRLINESSLTKNEVAERLGISISTLHRFLRGESHPSRQFVESLAEVLGLPADRTSSIIQRYTAERRKPS
ncbi:MAG TPA: helix-turn-helix domain-containing protein [Candidatus Saccharimonadales bacterium]|nr:helix-turn-helix domain-containing protein [Candidatus Saccharimonadales bacterium]